MLNQGNRKILVNKDDLISQIIKNKKNHVKEFNEAVIAYKKEALKQLKELTDKVNKGETNIKLNLIEPVNHEENYDKIIEMFRWEINSEVELTQQEFLEYIQDDTNFARNAKFANMSYL
jgi:hypothetical protein